MMMLGSSRPYPWLILKEMNVKLIKLMNVMMMIYRSQTILRTTAILNITAKESGIYRCIAKNKLGEKSQSMMFRVVGEFDPWLNNDFLFISSVCSGSVVVTAYDFESGRPGSNPEWGPIYYKSSITAQGLPKPSSLWSSTLGTRAPEHKGCNRVMQIDWWLQRRAVFGHSFSGISRRIPQK